MAMSSLALRKEGLIPPEINNHRVDNASPAFPVPATPLPGTGTVVDW